MNRKKLGTWQIILGIVTFLAIAVRFSWELTWGFSGNIGILFGIYAIMTRIFNRNSK